MRRKYAAQIKATAISDEHMGTAAVDEQINLMDAVPFDMVTALHGLPIPNVITLGAMNDTTVSDMASIVPGSPCCIITQKLLSASQENRSFCDVDMNGHVSDMSLAMMLM